MKTPLEFFLPKTKTTKGGKGSGNWGHGGLAGVHGGSSPRKGTEPFTYQSQVVYQLAVRRAYEQGNYELTDEVADKIQQLTDNLINKHTEPGEPIQNRKGAMDFIEKHHKKDIEYGFVSLKNGETVRIKGTETSVRIEDDVLSEMKRDPSALFIHNHPRLDYEMMAQLALSSSDVIVSAQIGENFKMASISKKTSGNYYLSTMRGVSRKYMEILEPVSAARSLANEVFSELAQKAKTEKARSIILCSAQRLFNLTVAREIGTQYYEIPLPSLRRK